MHRDPKLDERFVECYADLRRLAQSMVNWRAGNSLHGTLVANEAFLKAARGADLSRVLESKDVFMRFMTTTMRNLIKDWSRAKMADKRNPKLSEVVGPSGNPAETRTACELAAIEDLLSQRENTHPRQVSVFRYRFYSGLSIQELAEMHNFAEDTIKRDIRETKAWLKIKLEGTK